VALATFGRLCAGLTDASCFAGRIGGEEFALLVVGKERLYMVDLVERLRWFVSQNPTRLEAGPTLSLTFSGGIAQALTGDNWTSLFARADEVLYRAKEEGRDRSLVAA
jgi:diguanylate cyclase (GGDEF)-like protein